MLGLNEKDDVRTLVICSDHFTPLDYRNPEHIGGWLKPLAVPSVGVLDTSPFPNELPVFAELPVFEEEPVSEQPPVPHAELLLLHWGEITGKQTRKYRYALILPPSQFFLR